MKKCQYQNNAKKLSMGVFGLLNEKRPFEIKMNSIKYKWGNSIENAFI
jgi:hypothetical protein